MSWLSRLINVVRSDRLADDLDDELRFHIEATAERLRAEGWTSEGADHEARRRFGNMGAIRERSRDARLMPWLAALLRDARIGTRMLRKDAGATTAVVVSLGLAMGACTAAFMLVEALVLRKLPVHDPDRLVYLAMPPANASQSRESAAFSYPLYQRFVQAVSGRAELVAVGYQSQRRASFHDARAQDDRVHPQHVSGNFFRQLGVAPALGRVLTPADDRLGASRYVAVLSHAFWQRRFGGDPSVLGRAFRLDREFHYEIVGVAREGFSGVEPGVLTDFWIPATTFRSEALTMPTMQWLSVWGRLAPGIGPQALEQQLQPVLTAFRKERAATFPVDAPADERRRFISQPLVARSAGHGTSFLRREFERPLWVLAAIVSLVLLLACSNVANLLLARAAARDREMALRMSIGAGRRRLVQQLLVESALLGVAACVLGAIAASLAAPALVRWLAPADDPAYLQFGPNAPVVAFLVLLVAATTLSFGLLPALRASAASPVEALKSAATGRSTGRAGALNPLVMLQLAFSLTVVFLAGLLMLSFDRLVKADLGFVPQGVVLAEVEAAGRVDPQIGKRAVLDLLARLQASEHVVSASVAAWPLLRGWSWSGPIRLPGQSIDSRQATFLEVSPDFLQTMRIALQSGRDFTMRDVEPAEPGVVIVNQAFARTFFPGVAAVIGRRFDRLENASAVVSQQIVGLVGDVKYRSLRDAAPPTVYVPLRGRRGASVQVRSSAPLELVASRVRAEAARTSPSLLVTDIALQTSLVERGRLRERLLALLSGFFALVSLALAAIGLYGVLSYSVVRRTREIGIRRALGAGRGAVVRQVLGRLAPYAGAGLAIGLAGGLYAARFLKTLLYEVEPLDAVSLLSPMAALTAVGMIAALVPARRAASVDPLVALRDE